MQVKPFLLEYNTTMSKSTSLRRIKADIRELSIDPSDQYYASPLENDMFEWHFTIRGAAETDFAGGVYHGRILLPSDYPFKPPNIVFLTPSGRFETGVKVCLSFSAHHPELWQPAWGIRLILEALISFLPTPADGAIGALDWTSEERKKLALESIKYRCPVCCCGGVMTCSELLPTIKKTDVSKKTMFQEEIEKLKLLQFQNHAITTEEETKKKNVGNDEGEMTNVKNDVVVKGGEVKCDEMDRKSPPELLMVEEKEPFSEDITADPQPTPTLVEEEDQLSETKIIDDSVQLKSPPEDLVQQQQIDISPDVPPPSTTTSELAISQRVIDNTQAQTQAAEAQAELRQRLANEQPRAFQHANDAENNAQRERIVVVDPLPFLGVAAAAARSDYVLNGLITFVSIIVIVLLRQSHMLVEELYTLGEESEGAVGVESLDELL